VVPVNFSAPPQVREGQDTPVQFSLADMRADLLGTQRRMAQPAFGKATLARVVQNTGTLTTQLLADWEQAARRGEPVDVLDDMQHLAMRVIGMALFGRDLENDLQAGLADTAGADARGGRGANCFTETVRAGVQVVALRNFSPAPLPLWVPTRLHRRFRRGLAAVDRFVYARIDERLADPGGYDDMLADLVRSYGDQAAAADTRRELRDQVVTLFFAGFETTAVALAWTWLLLGQHQAAEARFHQELAAVLGGRAPAAEDLKALGYTGQVVQESMRMYSPVSFGQRRCLGAGFATAEMMTVLAVAGQRVRLRRASAEPVTIIPAVTQRPAGGLPMLVEVRS
jgi:cytochrome P450